jgi:TM2 domain-containing membrane protein YozV
LEALDRMEVQNAIKTMDNNQKTIYYEQKKKNPGVMAAASFIVPGLGQFLMGKIGKGLAILLLCWLVVPWIYGIYDAYNSAKNYNADLYMLVYPGQTPTVS